MALAGASRSCLLSSSSSLAPSPSSRRVVVVSHRCCQYHDHLLRGERPRGGRASSRGDVRAGSPSNSLAAAAAPQSRTGGGAFPIIAREFRERGGRLNLHEDTRTSISAAGSAAAAAAMLAALVATTSWWEESRRKQRPWPLPLLLAAAPLKRRVSFLSSGLTPLQVSKCEGGGNAAAASSSQQHPPPFHSAANLFQHHMSKEKEKDDANDYHHDHDEDEDEDAHEQQQEKPECFLCRVHRQGPCGAIWRELEACVDRNEVGSRGRSTDETNGSNDPCRDGASWFEHCWKKHAGLYSLIALDEQSQILQQLKKQMDVTTGSGGGSSAAKDSASLLSPSAVPINWEPWIQFLASSSASHDIVKNYRRRISQNGNVRFRGPLWKRFDKHQMTNPLLVTVSAQVPRTFESQTVLYGIAVDQQNRVLGFLEVPLFNDENGSNDDDKSSLNMKIIIVPGLTESVKIQLWTVPPPSSLAQSIGRRKVVVHETSPQPVDYGASTNNMLAIQNQRTRTQKVKSTS